MRKWNWLVAVGTCGVALLASAAPKSAPPAKPPQKKAITEADLPWPPTLPNGQTVVTDTSEEFLKPSATLKEGVKVAKTAPTIDFLFYPGQDYPGKPWSNWGDSVAVNGKYYSAIGDHQAIGDKGDGSHGTGTGFVFEYDPATKALREIVNTTKVLNLPAGHYTPGKIHSRLDIGSDGYLYFATHRGSERSAADKNHYLGDWVMRVDPATAKAEVVVQGPVAKHSTPCSVLDGQRMIFYGGTAAGPDADVKGIQFFAYDVKNRKMLYSRPNGPARYMILAQSTGRVYFVPGNKEGQLMRYDPAAGGPPVEVKGATMGIRAATKETPEGFVYAVSSGQGAAESAVWPLNTKTEEVKQIGTAAVGAEAYIASIDVDPTGRFLYYVPGAHGSGPRDNSPVVQFDVKTGAKKVIAFVHPFYEQKYGADLRGTFATAMDAGGKGDVLYVTWNISRGTKAWDCTGMTAIHIPESERQP
jgi:hypothetical protein